MTRFFNERGLPMVVNILIVILFSTLILVPTCTMQRTFMDINRRVELIHSQIVDIDNELTGIECKLELRTCVIKDGVIHSGEETDVGQ